MSRTVFVALFLVFGSVEGASACSCIGPPEPLVAFAGAEAVVAGVIVGVAHEFRLSQSQGVFSSGDLIGWLVAVSDVWKGEVVDTMVVYSERESSSCGFPFQAGTKYLIYGYLMQPKHFQYWNMDGVAPDSTMVRTSICTRTRNFGRAQEDLDLLPDPIAVFPSP